ncbi:MAG: hypothetical protein AB9834_06360 [Lentimicrobium sp.]
MIDTKILTIIVLAVVAIAIVFMARNGKLSFLGGVFDFSKKQSKAEVEQSKKVEVDQTGDASAKVTGSEDVKINQKN